MRTLLRCGRVVLGPLMGISLAGYFAYHLVEGDRGLNAWFRLGREIRDENAKLRTVQAHRAGLDLRVTNLRPEHVDSDLLDERVRATLNLVARDDIVIMQPTPSH